MFFLQWGTVNTLPSPHTAIQFTEGLTEHLHNSNELPILWVQRVSFSGSKDSQSVGLTRSRTDEAWLPCLLHVSMLLRKCGHLTIPWRNKKCGDHFKDFNLTFLISRYNVTTSSIWLHLWPSSNV